MTQTNVLLTNLFFCSLLWPKVLSLKRRPEMNYDSRGEAWQAAIEYHLRVGYKVLSLHLSLEACSLQTCFFFFLSFMFFFPAITLSSSTSQIWWLGSGSYNFSNAIFTDFDFFEASFTVVGQFHTHRWKIWALRSKYKDSANTWTQSSCQWQHRKGLPSGSTCRCRQPSLMPPREWEQASGMTPHPL